jgi:predicted permease
VSILWQDLRYALRMLRKGPGFTAAAILTLALGIGANASIFTFVDALLLRSLNVVAPEQLVWVAATTPDGSTSTTHSYRFYEILRDMETRFRGVCAYGPRSTAMTFGENTERISAGLATGEFFHLLGARQHLGRLFGPADDRTPGAHPVAVLEYRFWQDRFGSDPEVVGQQILLAGHPFTIIGVAEQGFVGPSRGSGPDLWAPMTMTAEVLPSFSSWRQVGLLWLSVLARMQPGVTVEQARAAAQVGFQRYTNERIGTGISSQRAERERARHVMLEPAAYGRRSSYERYRQILTLLGAIVGLLLLIACANVASLLLARASSRRQEIAVRLAIGAGRGRLVRQLLTESLLLALIGAALGLLLSWYLNPPLASYLGLERADLLPQVPVIVFAVALSGVTTLLFGLAPAWKASRLSLSSWLKGAGQVGTERGHWGLRGAFVTAQIALCLPTLIAAGLLLRSLLNLYAIDVGLQTRQLVQGMIDPRSNGYDDPKIAAIYDDLLERLQLRPEVLSAALGSSGAFSGYFSGRTVYREDAIDPDAGNAARYIQTSEDYLATLGIPLLAGRFLERTDTVKAPLVTVVSETLARELFGSENVLGRGLKFSVNHESRWTIVGVVGDTKGDGLREETKPTLYLSYRQQTTEVAFLYLRTRGNAGAAAEMLREELRAVDPHLPVFGLRTMEEQIEFTLRDDRTLAGFLIGFGFAGLLLAAVGLYGVLAYGVTRRFRELGLRKALGARDAHLIRLVAASGARWVGAGLVIGCGLALALTRLLEQTLFGIEASDAGTYLFCAAFLALVAMLAAYLPARRAARIEPMEALRYE